MMIKKKMPNKPKKAVVGRPKDEEKRQAIVKAAKKHFLRHGFEAANMDKIAAAAGVSKQTVYGHFMSKEDLFKTIISEKCQEANAHEHFEHLHGEPPEQSLRKIADGFLAVVLSPDALGMHQVITSESSRHPKIAKLFFEAGPMKMHAACANYLKRLDQEGLLKIGDASRAAHHFFAMLKGVYHFRMTMNIKPAPTPKEIEEHTEDCVATFLRAYRR